jgi:glycosyltransferase involved in cell wall biosynthesis
VRIGLISALYPPSAIGGAEIMSKQLVDGLRDQGIDVSVLTLQDPMEVIEDEKYIKRTRLNNIYCPYDLNQKSNSTFKRLFWHTIDSSNTLMASKVKKWAKEQKLDIINTHNLQGFSTAIWPVLQELKIPIVHVLHDFSLLCPRTVLYKNGRICGDNDQRCIECRWLTAPRARHAESVSAIVGVSQFILQLHRDHGLFKKIRGQVIYNALEAAYFNKKPFRSELEPIKLGFLGRLNKAKGLDVLLVAAEILRLKGLSIHWVIAGRGEPDDIASWQIEYPYLEIEWRGHIEPSTLWGDIDALVFPSSSFEALGNVILEAGAAGRSTIATRHGGATELIDDGISGAFFEPRDPVDLANVIINLNMKPNIWRKMGIAASEKASKFTLSRRVEEFKKLFKDIIDEQRK